MNMPKMSEKFIGINFMEVDAEVYFAGSPLVVRAVRKNKKEIGSLFVILALKNERNLMKLPGMGPKTIVQMKKHLGRDGLRIHDWVYSDKGIR